VRITTRVRYATRMLIDIASRADCAPLPLREIADRQQVSVNYLKQLIGPLVAADLVRTERGNKGGVLLARPASDIKLGMVVRALQGSTAPVACVDDPAACERNMNCVSRGVWCRIKLAVDQVLDDTTIEDLVEQQGIARNPYVPQKYAKEGQ